MFSYTVKITNEGGESARLKSRHWIITDGDGNVQEVKGDGVVGAQPLLRPGQSFEYTSGCAPFERRAVRCAAPTRWCATTADARRLDRALFALALPHSLN